MANINNLNQLYFNISIITWVCAKIEKWLTADKYMADRQIVFIDTFQICCKLHFVIIHSLRYECWSMNLSSEKWFNFV